MNYGLYVWIRKQIWTNKPPQKYAGDRSYFKLFFFAKIAPFPLFLRRFLNLEMQESPVQSVKSWIPNGITLMNLMMGCVGVSLAAWGDIIGACHAVMLAALLDLFDGMAARALGVASPLGRDLDSLADVVSFGLLPGLILYQLAASVPGSAGTEWIVYVYTLSAALRLARFNQDARQTVRFMGLASPAAALLLVSAVAFLGQSDVMSLKFRDGLTKNLIYGIAFGVALLMLVPLPMPSLKSAGTADPSRRADLLILIGSALSGILTALLLSMYAGLFFSLLAYLLLSFIRLFVTPKFI